MRKEPNFSIKLTFVEGLEHSVTSEVKSLPEARILYSSTHNALYLADTLPFLALQSLRSAVSVSLVAQDRLYNPLYLSNHKSIIGTLIETVRSRSTDVFKTFKLSCAGQSSPEVLDIKRYIHEMYDLTEATEADLKLHIGKQGRIFEIGAELTARPLTMRPYRALHIEGGLNPTVAYAMNTYADLSNIHSYLNIFSGSATLLIEAWLSNPSLHLVGIDNNKETLTKAYQNLKKAGCIGAVTLHEADIHVAPHYGTFDVITSDLPFGMSIGKDDNLTELYSAYVAYCAKSLAPGGKLISYTTEHELLGNILDSSGFTKEATLPIKFLSSVDAYMTPHIIVSSLRT